MGKTGAMNHRVTLNISHEQPKDSWQAVKQVYESMPERGSEPMTFHAGSAQKTRRSMSGPRSNQKASSSKLACSLI